jgi:endonuclease-3
MRSLGIGRGAERARRIARRLIEEYPDARCMLDHADPFQLLVATILAAQCTDERVNMVTPAQFRRVPTARDLAVAELAELEDLVRSTGFYRSKAKSIKGAAETLKREFPAIIVDTHVRRVAQRLALASSSDPDEIEKELCGLLPDRDWTAFSHAGTFHGRKICAARKPDHGACVVRRFCPEGA